MPRTYTEKLANTLWNEPTQWFNHTAWYVKFPELQANKIPGVAMLSYALAYLFGCTFYRFGGDYNCIMIIVRLVQLLCTFLLMPWYQTSETQKDTRQPTSWLKNTNIEFVASASGQTMVEGLNCAWVYLGHSTAKRKKVLGSLLHITLPWPSLNSGTLPITSRSCEKSYQALHT